MATVRDFDFDGDMDVLGTRGQDSTSNSSFAWAENDGAGLFRIFTNIDSGAGDFLQGVTADRFDSAAATEIALSWHAANNGVQLLTLPPDPLQEQWTWSTLNVLSQDEQLSSGDIDNDGDIDILQGTKWLRNEGAGWTQMTVSNVPGAPDRNRLMDMNGDGRLDAVIGFEAISMPGKVAWYEQGDNIEAEWTEHVIGTVIGPMSLDVADMDGDSDNDVVVGEHNLANPSSASLYIFENRDGLGTVWTPHLVYTGDEHHDGAHLVDIDNDGDKDIVSIGWDNPSVTLYENLAVSWPGQARVVAPLISPSGGVFGQPISVSISDQTTGASIYYTTDETDPTTSSIPYSQSFVIATSTVVRARAFKAGLTDSPVTQASFSIDITGTEIVSVQGAVDIDTVTIVFNNPLDPVSATTIGNYSISGGVSVLAATIESDNRTVTLRTSPLSSGTTYTVAVENVRDLPGNPVTPGTEVQFSPLVQDVGNPFAHWEFNDGSGSSASDSSGNGHTASVVGALWGGGKIGGGMVFDGVDDYVDAGPLDVSGVGLTLSMWMRSDNLGNCSSTYHDCRLIAKATGTSEQQHYFMLSTFRVGDQTTLRFRLKTDGTTSTLTPSAGALAQDTWHHVAARYDGATMKLYIDGMEIGSMAKSGELSTNAAVPVWIGRNPDGYGAFDGSIDDVRIYDRALSEQDILTLAYSW